MFTPSSQFALSGLGQDLSQVLTSGGIQTGTAIGGALATHAIGTATTGAIIGAGLASAGIALAGVAIMSWLSSRRDNAMDKTNSSRIADQAERLLQENLAAWNASRKTVEDRELAYANAAAIMQWMAGPQGCGNPALEDPGRRCISERLVDNARYPWKAWYVDPISTFIPTVSAAAQQAATAAAGGNPPAGSVQGQNPAANLLSPADGGSQTAGVGSRLGLNLNPAWLAAAAVVLLYTVTKGGR
jgi:hypothetical protein